MRRALRPVRVFGRWLRLAVLLFAVLGLTPLAEVVEVAVAAAHPGDDDAPCGADCPDDCEKSCCHQGVSCGCCAPAPRVVSRPSLPLPLFTDAPDWTLDRARAPPTEGEAPPRRPPRS